MPVSRFVYSRSRQSCSLNAYSRRPKPGGRKTSGCEKCVLQPVLYTRITVLRSPSTTVLGQLGCRTRHTAGQTAHSNRALAEWPGTASLREERAFPPCSGPQLVQAGQVLACPWDSWLGSDLLHWCLVLFRVFFCVHIEDGI